MTPRIDRERVRDAIQSVERASLLILTDRALDLLSDGQLRSMLDGHIEAEVLAPAIRGTESLLQLTKRFHEASLQGQYYEDHDPKNWDACDLSPGTERFIADCHRLLDRCVGAVDHGEHEVARAAFELIFNVIQAIDAANDDILFFADDGGSWRFGINWRKVLPAWFRCLAASSDAPEYAEGVRSSIEAHSFPTERDALLEIACKVGSEGQRSALLNTIEAHG
ncbi:MAG: hypothetical protein ACE5FA_03660 [Dehalococcoidia bacterium]